MRKSILISIVALAVAATVASAADIKVIQSWAGSQWTYSSAGYNAAGITDDGTEVVVTRGTNNGTGAKMAMATVDTGVTAFIAGSNSNHAKGGAKWYDSANGVYKRIGGAGYSSTQAGARLVNNAQTLVVIKGKSGETNSVAASPKNNVSLDPTTGNGWMIGCGYAGAPNGCGVAWKFTGGNIVSANASWQQSMGTYTTHGLFGVSNSGLAAGAATGKGAVLCDLNNDSQASITEIPEFAGVIENDGAANAISAGATYAGGYYNLPPGDIFTDPNKDTQHAFRYEIGTASSEELMPAGGDIVDLSQKCQVFDIADNGFAVGYSRVGGVNNATVWLPGETDGKDLATWLVQLGVTMPADYQLLTVATSVTAYATGGQYRIAGQYVNTAGGTAAFVATVPEPGALALLALGLPFVMKRRRRS